MVTGIVILIVCVLAVVFWLVGIRNRLVELRNDVQYRWSEVDLQLQHRSDLAKSLLASAKNYAGESPTLLESAQAASEKAVAARQDLWRQGGPIRASLASLAIEEGAAAATIEQLNRLADDHPDLKASTGWQRLIKELQEIENSLMVATQAYNEAANHYNRRLGQAPASWIARQGDHRRADLFEFKT